MHERVVVLGLDGASWRCLHRMIELGAMPQTKGELDNAARGILQSSYPPVTPSAWPSISTGVNPGKHGIFDFASVDPVTGQQRLTSTLDLEHPRIYEMVAMQGIQTLVFEPMPSYPLIPMENINIVSSFLAPKPVCYPDHMKRYIESYPEYTETFEARRGKSLDKELFLELKLHRTRQRLTVIQDALNREDWRLAWLRLQDPDNMLHSVADEIYAGHPKAVEIFALIDELVKTLRHVSDLVVMVSDHGFERYDHVVNINSILYDNGFIRLATSQGVLDYDAIMGDHGHAEKNPTHSAAFPITFGLLRKVTDSKLRFVTNIGRSILKIAGVEYQFPRVDPVSSSAYYPTPNSYGIVVKDETQLRTVQEILMNSRGISSVKRREEMYWGPYVGRALPLMIIADYERGYKLGSNRVETRSHFDDPAWDHHPHGIISFTGEGVSSRDLGVINAWDVAPTIMSYMGIPIPNDTDGRLLIDFSDWAPESCDYVTLWRRIKSSMSSVTGNRC